MEQLHYKVYKPAGMLSQMDSGEERQRRKKRFLSELYNFPKGIMPIGRLDEKSEGLLLMTTDGKLSDTINSSGIEKEYIAQLDGIITLDAIEQLKTGMTIGIFGKDYLTKHCTATILTEEPILPDAHPLLRIGRHRPTSWISITILEGKFRQIRKMTAAVGFPTVRLVRVRIGTILLADMQPGTVLELNDEVIRF